MTVAGEAQNVGFAAVSAANAPRLPLDAVDFDGLTEALGDGSYETRWYINVTSGDVRPNADWSDGFDDDELDEQGWLQIEPAGGRAGFEDMEVFANAVGDLRARDLLLRSLQGKGAFRRFRDTMRELPDLKAPWNAWLTAREDARAINWLIARDLVDELGTDVALAEKSAAARAAIDQIRGLGGAVYELADAPASWQEIIDRLAAGNPVTLTRGGRPYAAITVYEDA